ncbi:MAG: tetratricopeptide repeat protein [Caldilineaceae bacterium]
MTQFTGAVDQPSQAQPPVPRPHPMPHPVPPPHEVADNRAIFTDHLLNTLRLLAPLCSGDEVWTQPIQARLFATVDLALGGDDPGVWEAACGLLMDLAPQLDKLGPSGRWTEILAAAVRTAAVLADNERTARLALQLGTQLRLQGVGGGRAQYRHALALTSSNVDSAAELRPAATVIHAALSRLAYLARLQVISAAAEQHARAALALIQGQVDEGAEESVGQRCAGDRGRGGCGGGGCGGGGCGGGAAVVGAAVVAYSTFVLGTIAHDRRELDEAAHYLRRALAAALALADRHAVAQRSRDLGLVLAEAGNLEEAQGRLEAAVAHFGAVQAVVMQAVAQMNLGIVYSRQGDPLRALDCYAAAQPIFAQAQDRFHLALLYNNQGVDYRAIGRPAEAVQLFQASIAIRRTLANERALANVLDNLGRAYLDLGDQAAARASFTEALTLLAGPAADERIRQLRAGIAEQLARLER